MTHDGSERNRLSEAQVQELLRRAAEIDTTDASTLTLADVKRIAQDAGISQASVDRAYREIQGNRSRRTSLFVRRLAVLLGVAAGALYCTWWGRAIANDGVTLGDLVGLITGTAVTCIGTWGVTQALHAGSRRLAQRLRGFVADA